jgi:hypothetical protein
VPATYFLVTFTLPPTLRDLAFSHQRTLYTQMTRCAWHTLKTFAQNDKQLQGIPGAIAVLHTHSRRLDYHPHVHLVVPAAAVDAKNRLWRTKRAKGKHPYLFNHKALAKVCSGSMKTDTLLSGILPINSEVRHGAAKQTSVHRRVQAGGGQAR